MTRLIVLGGFLGAGKTTTLLQLAHRFGASGRRVGIISNDQGHELVDTEIFRASGFETKDVRGGCFCCRLDEFIEQVRVLELERTPDVLLAEPVGSCTDIVATVLRPLQRHYAGRLALAPFTVVVDPLRARDVLAADSSSSLSEKITYVYKLQQLEAEAIALNKCDLLEPRELDRVEQLLRNRLPSTPIIRYSAHTGEGFDELQRWLAAEHFTGAHPTPDIDYDVYAAGEAELAWFDAAFELRTRKPVFTDHALLALGAVLREQLDRAQLSIAHVKAVVRAGEAVSALSIVSAATTPQLSRSDPVQVENFEVLVNARVAASPERLRDVVQASVREWATSLDARLTAVSASAFSPPRPVPTQRLARAAPADREIGPR